MALLTMIASRFMLLMEYYISEEILTRNMFSYVVDCLFTVANWRLVLRPTPTTLSLRGIL